MRVKRPRATDDLEELQLTYDNRGIKRSRLLTETEAVTGQMQDLFKPKEEKEQPKNLLAKALYADESEETTVKVQKVDVKKFGFDLPGADVPEHRKKVEDSIVQMAHKRIQERRDLLRQNKMLEKRKGLKLTNHDVKIVDFEPS